MKLQLKYEAEFIQYLATTYKSRDSGIPLTPKVISDTTGRLKRIELILGINIFTHTKSHRKFKELSALIKLNDSSLRHSPTGNVYGYSRYIYPAHLYYKFICWKLNKTE